MVCLFCNILHCYSSTLTLILQISTINYTFNVTKMHNLYSKILLSGPGGPRSIFTFLLILIIENNASYQELFRYETILFIAKVIVI